MRIKKYLSLGVIVIALIAGCSSNSTRVDQSKLARLEIENSSLKEQIAKLEEEKSRGVFNGHISMTYVEYNFKKRFIPKASQILALPVKGSYILRKIEPNTVVTVFDAVACGQNELWLYVEVPVYDSPMNMKGWIPEAETVALTKENVKLVQSDVIVGKGTNIYQVFEFEKIPIINPVKATFDMRGRLEEKRNGWARLSCPGGSNIWVQEKDLVYPMVE